MGALGGSSFDLNFTSKSVASPFDFSANCVSRISNGEAPKRPKCMAPFPTSAPPRKGLGRREK